MRSMLLCVLLCTWPAAMTVAAQPQAVRPAALATCSQRDTLLVADAAHGRVLAITLNDSSSTRETTIGRSLVDLARLADDRFVAVDRTGRGFADPTGVVALDDGFAVLSGGARQLSVQTNGTPIQYIDVGRRPTRLLLLAGNRLAVTNEHDSTISIVSLTGKAEANTIGLGAEGSFPVSAGEAAFYDASLAHDTWMTCNSCHVDGHTPGLRADTLGDGTFGDAKLIHSLFGAKRTRPYGWLGNKPDLSSQIAATMASTMHAKDPPSDVTTPLVDFISGLELPRTAENADQITEFGRRVFKSRKCNECHQAPAFTSTLVRDVGLKDASGNAAFNPPSLRGLRHRRAFFHDGRAESLEQVFEVYEHQLNGDLSDEELRRLITYLKSL